LWNGGLGFLINNVLQIIKVPREQGLIIIISCFKAPMAAQLVWCLSYVAKLTASWDIGQLSVCSCSSPFKLLLCHLLLVLNIMVEIAGKGWAVRGANSGGTFDGYLIGS
jgi:hypothetical protein